MGKQYWEYQGRGFQWEKYEEWRGHPLLQFHRRTSPFQGFTWAVGAFLAYVAYDLTCDPQKRYGDNAKHH